MKVLFPPTSSLKPPQSPQNKTSPESPLYSLKCMPGTAPHIFQIYRLPSRLPPSSLPGSWAAVHTYPPASYPKRPDMAAGSPHALCSYAVPAIHQRTQDPWYSRYQSAAYPSP